MSEPSCPFCGESLFETYNNLDGTTRPMCGICGAIWPSNRYQEKWNQRPGEATARREALNEVTKELIDQHQNPGEKIQLLTNWSARSVLKVITKLLEEKP